MLSNSSQILLVLDGFEDPSQILSPLKSWFYSGEQNLQEQALISGPISVQFLMHPTVSFSLKCNSCSSNEAL